MNSTPDPIRPRSPFGVLAVVFTALLIGYATQFWGLARQNRQLRRFDASLEQALPRARVISDKLQAVSKDLVDLAAISPAARQIVNEFEIRLAPPAR